MTADLVLHYAPDNASLCVRLALEELGLPYETRLVDRARNGQRAPSYLALNPNGLIPTLETPAGALFETGAILLSLADQTPGTIFAAPDSVQRGPALTRLFWLSNTLHANLRMLFYPDQYAPSAEDMLHQHTQIRLKALFTQLNADAAYFITDKPSIISCYLAPLLRWSALYGRDTRWFTPDRWPNLMAFARDFETRPAAVRAATAEGLGATPFSAPSFPTPPEGSAT